VRSTTFIKGKIETSKQIEAAKAVRDLENEALKVADSLMAFDETESVTATRCPT
jgi:hypothetical protein